MMRVFIILQPEIWTGIEFQFNLGCAAERNLPKFFTCMLSIRAQFERIESFLKIASILKTLRNNGEE